MKSFIDNENRFTEMYEQIDIDEKCYFVSQVTTSFLHGARRGAPDTGVWWDGKIGTWFFAEKVPAKQSSVNRCHGTLETKSFKDDRCI